MVENSLKLEVWRCGEYALEKKFTSSSLLETFSLPRSQKCSGNILVNKQEQCWRKRVWRTLIVLNAASYQRMVRAVSSEALSRPAPCSAYWFRSSPSQLQYRRDLHIFHRILAGYMRSRKLHRQTNKNVYIKIKWKCLYLRQKLVLSIVHNIYMVYFTVLITCT